MINMRVFNHSSLILLLVSIFLSGCIIQSRQLNSLVELVREPLSPMDVNSWNVRISGYESIVYSVITPDGILFSNNMGDQVLFDGWVVRKVRGMGNRKLDINIYDVLNVRTFEFRNRVVSKHSCDQWEQEKSSGVVRYVQYCRDRQTYKNSILVQNDGDISMIRQIVDNRYTVLTLTKLE